jgi:hypothetical protein
MIVVTIIMVMAAVSLPAIARFIRNYEINGAAKAVAGEIQAARAKAITKNVNYGVDFVIVDNQTYRYVFEDDMTGTNSGVRQTPAALLAANPPDAAQLGPARLLPNGVTFGTGCAGFVANDSGFRFNRFGAWCDPGSTGCNAIGAGANLLMNPNQATSTITGAVGSRICLWQASTGLTRLITVAPGGRVTIQ